jgi:hypothetical protein
MVKTASIPLGPTSFSNYIHPVATVLLAWAISSGGFPQAPQFFQQLCQNELFQYFLVFVLVYQGGGRQDVGTALMVTVGLYLITKILSLRSLVGEVQQQRIIIKQEQPLPPAGPSSGVPAPPVRENFQLFGRKLW